MLKKLFFNSKPTLPAFSFIKQSKFLFADDPAANLKMPDDDSEPKDKNYYTKEELDTIPFNQPFQPKYKLKKMVDRGRKKLKLLNARRDKDMKKLKTLEALAEKNLLGKIIALEDNIIKPFEPILKIDDIVFNKTELLSREYSNVYYSPMSNAEIEFTRKCFSTHQAQSIFAGGRGVLKQEILSIMNNAVDKKEEDKDMVNNNKQRLEKLKSTDDFKSVWSNLQAYEEISKEDIDFLRSFYPDYFVYNLNTRMLIFHEGKSMVTSLKNLASKQKQTLSEAYNALEQTKVLPFLNEGVKIHNEDRAKFQVNDIVLESLAAFGVKQEEVLEQVLKTKDFIDNLTKQKLSQDDFDYQISNISLIKGLSRNPLNNKTVDCYENMSPPERKDLIVFTSKPGEANGHFNRNVYFSDNDINDLYNDFRLIFRTTLVFKKKNDTWDDNLHVALFDNELILPNTKENLGYLKFPDMFKLYTYRDCDWHLTDIDNTTDSSLLMKYTNSTIIDLLNIYHTYVDANIMKLYDCSFNKKNYFTSSENYSFFNGGRNNKSNKNSKETEKKSKQKGKEDKENNSKEDNVVEVDDTISGISQNYRVSCYPNEMNTNIIGKSLFKEKKKIMSEYETLKEEALLTQLALRTSNLTGISFQEVQTCLNSIKQCLNDWEKCFSSNNLDKAKEHQNSYTELMKRISPLNILDKDYQSKVSKESNVSIDDWMKEREAACKEYHQNFTQIVGSEETLIEFDHEEFEKQLGTEKDLLLSSENAMKHVRTDDKSIPAKYPVFDQVNSLQKKLAIMDSVDLKRPKKVMFNKERLVRRVLNWKRL